MSRLFRRRSPTTPSPAVSPANVGVPPAPAQVPVGPWTLRRALTRSWLGRILLVIWVAQVAVGDVGGWLSGGLTPARALWRAVASAAVVVVVLLLVRLLGTARRRLLWRVRRRLILSYIFIGVVPALLLVAFFVFAGLLMFFHVSAYLFKRGIDDIVDEARTVAETAAIEIRRASGPGSAGAVLERKVANAAPRYAGVSLAVVPRAASRRAGGPAPVTTVGPWRHAEPPAMLPEWVSVGGFGGLLAFAPPGETDETDLVVRAVGLPDERDPAWAVVVDLPVDVQVLAQLRDATGIELRNVSAVQAGDQVVLPAQRPADAGPAILNRAHAGTAGGWAFNSVSLFDFVDWQTGRTGTLALSVRVSIRAIYDRISAAQSRIGNLSLGELFMVVLGAIAVLFLIIEIAALAMGLMLARSITGSVHQLFEGTERVRLGDFSHRIRIETRDQLGELAESFNEMTASIESLLRQAEEKRRLEEELRIAREIQMSLLPRGPLVMPGLTLTALCIPAREVGGDYYDFFPLGDRRLGVLIADVAGKGTSAALYMAELKGVVLSLAKIYQSPRQLLIEVNRIISDNLDSRSFITMTYAVVDLERHSVTYARAGHTPLIHCSARDGGRARVLIPDGLVLGLRIDGVEEKFAQLLEECTLPLHPGDVLVLYTDGISEAMDPDGDLFGDARLQQLVEQHAHLPSDQLRERILREVQAFVGPADQHDDMTMILLKVEDMVADQVSAAA